MNAAAVSRRVCVPLSRRQVSPGTNAQACPGGGAGLLTGIAFEKRPTRAA